MSYMADYLNSAVGAEKLELESALAERLGLRDLKLGQVATRGFEPTASMASGYVRSLDAVYTRTRAKNPTLGWAMWTTNNNNEVYYTGTTTFIAALEYPAGVFTYSNENIAAGTPGVPAPFTFNLGGADKLLKATFNVDIPRRKLVKIWAMQDGDRVFWRQGQTADMAHPGCGMYSATGARPGLLDTFGTNFSEYSFPPSIFAAMTRHPSVLVFHDSREECTSDGPRPPFYDNGLVTPSLAGSFGYSQMGHSGQSLTGFMSAANKSQRISLAKYFTHVGNLWGINDINGSSRTAAQLLADDIAFAALFPDNEVFTCTMAPVTLSTDAFSTLANQTYFNGIVQLRIANENRRKGVAGYSFCLDVLDKIDPNGTYKWPVSSNPNLTARETACRFTGSISGATLTVTAITSGVISINDPFMDSLTGSTPGPTQRALGVVILDQLTGTPGGTGTYRISRPQTPALASREWYSGGYGSGDNLHQNAPLSKQIEPKLRADVLAFFA